MKLALVLLAGPALILFTHPGIRFEVRGNDRWLIRRTLEEWTYKSMVVSASDVAAVRAGPFQFEKRTVIPVRFFPKPVEKKRGFFVEDTSGKWTLGYEAEETIVRLRLAF